MLRRRYSPRRRDPQRYFTSAQRAVILRRAGWRCQWRPKCRRKINFDNPLQCDHIVPWSMGGPTALWNAQALCRYHNFLKSGQLPPPRTRRKVNKARKRYDRGVRR